MKAFFNLFLILFLIKASVLKAQELNINGGFLIKGTLVLGNQNKSLQIGAFGFGALNYGKMSLESGLSFVSYQFIKRHTKKINGLAFSYEGFTLVGIGNNTNLLGSSVSKLNNEVIYNPNGKGGFIGLGFGFSKDYLPKELKSYGIKNGQFIMRFSKGNKSMHTIFTNDFKIGKLFNGERTDYATTGSFYAGYTSINKQHRVFQTGIGIALFTAQPNYSKSPRNPLNSDDGRKNVWFTLPPFKDLFYSNLYGFVAYQDANYSVSSKIGINSERLGAYVQNKLHDGFGLNPRFPWNVAKKDKLYYEFIGSINYTNNTDD
ncbi:hypothetical protein H9I45_02640 [Polaribacter haliotis]|uniref:Bacterial toxin 23 domain-containing protein n=1 Tax=Polaribacter haliotis TaxID=1888915 RepID=A0A7L8AH83_9FLAO|nr:hypothetical protein [Polaribacter haliotis]QOD61363.1 hypothetical protein H9I45_02640 [Polaribacter haliotis]